MMIREGDKIRLKSGDTAFICEILAAGKMYLGEIIHSGRRIGVEHIAHEDIVGIFEEVEHPLAKVM